MSSYSSVNGSSGIGTISFVGASVPGRVVGSVPAIVGEGVGLPIAVGMGDIVGAVGPGLVAEEGNKLSEGVLLEVGDVEMDGPSLKLGPDVMVGVLEMLGDSL